MAIVTGNQLHRYMSEPRWTPAQWATANEMCAQVERDLESLLYGAVISPREMVEDAPIARSGNVETRLPVFDLISVGGVVAPDGAPPLGYWLDGVHLYTAASGPVGGPRRPGDPIYVGTVRVHYMGGWGDDPGLVEAILRKAKIRMGNRHADTMVVTGMTASAPPSEGPEHWTEDDLKSLNRYRRLGWPGET